MIYCLECKDNYDHRATDWLFIRCPECHSSSVVYYEREGEVAFGGELKAPISNDRIPRIMEKLEAIWWDNSELNFCQLLGKLTRNWARLAGTDDMELEEALDDLIWKR